MNRFLLAMLMSLLIVVSAMPAEAPTDAPESDAKRSKDSASAKPIDFSVGEELRDPFWPVNYKSAVRVRAKAEPGAKDEGYQKALAKLRYGGIIKQDKKYYATVNGTSVRAGDVIAVTVDGVVFKFRVHSIDMKGVRFKPVE